MIGGGAYFDSWKFYEYRVLVPGLTYILIGYAFSKNERTSFSNFLYGFGILGFLGSALSLGGWEPNQNVFWELIYSGLIFETLFLCVHIKSKSFLTWGTLFLMAYILKITSEYFSSGLGWPLALAIAALAGGATIWKGALRVGFWGALAMAATALIGKIFGTIV